MSKLSKLNLLLFVGMMLLLIVMFGCDDREKSAARPQAPPPEVGVMTITPQRVELTTELTGRTVPHLVAEVRPQVGGIIQKRLFIEGAEVKRGDLLYQIDPASYQAAHDNAMAALARTEAQLEPARLKEERFRDLVKINAVSQQEYDEVSAAYKQAEAEVAAARATLRTVSIDLGYTAVRAPISGHISRSAVTTGALVKASQDQPLATIQQLDPIYVDVTQSSSELLALKRNLASGLIKSSDPQQAEARLLLEDGSEYDLSGRLKFSEVTVDPTTGSVILRTLFPNPEKLLLPGMFVRVILREGVHETAILVPQRGVSRDPAGNAVVMVVNEEQKVLSRIIQVERTIGDNWLVSEGLMPGERIILEGFQRARPGTEVRAVPFEEAAAAPPAAEAR